jgi:hypothetical protein
MKRSFTLLVLLASLMSFAHAQAATGTEDSETKAVLQTMHVYQDAYEALDIAGLKKIWPQIPKATEAALLASFRTVRDLKLHMACKNVIVQGDSGEVTCSQKPEIVKSNERQSVDRFTQVFRLQKDKGSWYIVSANLVVP